MAVYKSGISDNETKAAKAYEDKQFLLSLGFDFQEVVFAPLHKFENVFNVKSANKIAPYNSLSNNQPLVNDTQTQPLTFLDRIEQQQARNKPAPKHPLNNS